jgi:hypothetical protein
MGIHREPNYRIYWENPKPNGLIHALSKHITLNRYENLQRYLRVSPKEPMESQKPLEPCLKDSEDLEL